MTDYEQQLQLARERALRYGQQAQYQAPQGRMVGNIYVAPNPLEYLAAGLRSLGGMRGQQMAEDELRQLQTTRQQAVADALRGFNENMQFASNWNAGNNTLARIASPKRRKTGAKRFSKTAS